MLEELQTFFSNNTTMVIIAAIALIAMLGMFMFKSSLFNKSNPNVDMVMNEMCDPNTGICHPHSMMNMQTPDMMTMQSPDMMTMQPPTNESTINESFNNDNTNYDNTNYDNTNYDNTNYDSNNVSNNDSNNDSNYEQ